MTEEDVMQRAHGVARRCAGDGVLENQLANVLAHLKRHQDPQATLKLLEELPRSPFASRSGKTRHQLEKLKEHVGSELRRVSDWNEAARIVGWAKRLAPVYKKRSH